MAKFLNKPRFEIEHRGVGRASTCFPADYDKSDLLEVMHASPDWAVFYNARTGETVNCADFYKQLVAERELNDGM